MHISEYMRWLVKQFELRGQHRDTHTSRQGFRNSSGSLAMFAAIRRAYAG
jgi:hypothetical protein